MYYQRFGLAGPPFESCATHMALFLSTPYREASAAMEWGLLHETSGFSLLVGGPGTGKTTLIKALIAQHHRHIHTVLVQNSWLRSTEIMSLIVERLGGRVPDTRLGLSRALEDAINGLKPGERVVVIVDEAQTLDDARMEDLRLLSNCDSNQPRRLHFMLAGQNELLERLRTPALYNLNQRIGARAKLSPLNSNEAWDYAEYRLRQQGGSAEKVFNPRALRKLITASGGVLRQINVLCTAALACAHAQNERIVTSACARAAIAEYRNLHRSHRTFYRRFAAAGVAASVTVIAACAVAAALAVRHTPGMQSAPAETQSAPTIEMSGSIAADTPMSADVEKAPEIASRGSLDSSRTTGLGARSGGLSAESANDEADTSTGLRTRRPSAPALSGDASERNLLPTDTVPAVPAAAAPEIQANAAPARRVARRAARSRPNRRTRSVRANRSREMDSYAPESDDDAVDPSDRTPIEPDDSNAPTDVE